VDTSRIEEEQLELAAEKNRENSREREREREICRREGKNLWNNPHMIPIL